MNASSEIKNHSQSLIDHCKDRHWKLMQLFAQVEIEMSGVIGKTAPETFGNKLNELGDRVAERSVRAMLIGARNLVAHAHITTVEGNGEWLSCWKVADAKCGLDTRLMSKAVVTKWASDVTKELRGLLVKLEKTCSASG